MGNKDVEKAGAAHHLCDFGSIALHRLDVCWITSGDLDYRSRDFGRSVLFFNGFDFSRSKLRLVAFFETALAIDSVSEMELVRRGSPRGVSCVI